MLDDPARAWAPYRAGPGNAPGTCPRGPPAPPCGLRRPLGGPPARPARRACGQHRAVDRRRATEAATAARPREFEALLDAMAAELGASADLTRLQAIWLYRMIFTPHPLRERMTLFWHNHFATSRRQGPERRADAAPERPAPRARPGRLPALLAAIGKDPAMLIWLDSTINRKAKPERELRPRGDGAVHASAAATTPRRTSRRPPAPSPAGSSSATGSRRSPRSTTTARRPSWAGRANCDGRRHPRRSCWSSPPAPSSSAASCSATS